MNKPLKVDLNNFPADYCPCGCPFFRERTFIKRIPGLLTGQSEPQIVNVAFMACEKCGRPHVATAMEVPRPKTKEQMGAEKNPLSEPERD
jgi:hypothetical protein